MNFRFLFIAAGFSLALAACSEPTGEAAATGDAAGTAAVATADATVYTIDAATSSAAWEGTKPTGKHTGVVPVSSGTISVLDNNITAGSFELNLAGLTVTDLTGKEKTDLEGHLKTGDFFEVEKFPKATFTITKVEAAAAGGAATHNITGDLKMKEKVKSVTIPATVTIADGKLTATAPAFTINRTDWGIVYNSSMINTAKDKLINDNVGLTLNIVANTAAANAPAPAAH